MVGKIIGIFFKVLGFGLAFWLLSYLLISMTTDFFNDYNIYDTEDHPAIVTEKVSEKSLTGRPKYFVIVDLNEVAGYNVIKNKVPAWKFRTIEVGDTVKGHYIQGNHFFTTLDIVTDSFLFICLAIVLLIFILALLAWPIILFIENKEKKKEAIHKHKRKNKVKRKIIRKTVYHKKKENRILKKILPKKAYGYLSDYAFSDVLLKAMLVIALVFTSGFIINGIQKFAPIGKTKTIAMVADLNAKNEIYYAVGKYSDPYFSLDLRFSDENDNEYRVIKEVTRSVYRKHAKGDTVEISYITLNPYNIFVRDYTAFNLLEITGYVKFTFYIMFLFGCFVFYLIKYFDSD